MREIIYTYNTLGTYETTDSTYFKNDSQIKLIIEPHDFSLKLGDETLRKTSCAGYYILVSNNGALTFYDDCNNVLDTAEKTAKTYTKVILKWSKGSITLQFGHIEEVDNYPNCDGESDRWSTEWITEYQVTFNTVTNKIEI